MRDGSPKAKRRNGGSHAWSLWRHALRESNPLLLR